MTKNEKARRTAGTVKRGTETANCERPFTKINNITENTGNQEERQKYFVEGKLPHGEHNAVKTEELLKITGYRTARLLQAAIEKERERGAVILSTCRHGGGYFLPSEGEAGKAEIETFVRTLSARARHTFRALRTARKALKELEADAPRET